MNPVAHKMTFVLGSLLVLALAFTAPPAHGDDHASDPRLAPEFLRDLAAARRATAVFHDFETAVDAGWDLQASPCEETVLGGMGEHHVNLDLWLAGGLVDVTLPQALLYEPQRNGRKRLVGVEYIVPSMFVGPDGPPPSLFGQDFHFNPFIPGNGAWALHAWIWRHNPEGIFADWNPNVSCQFAN